MELREIAMERFEPRSKASKRMHMQALVHNKPKLSPPKGIYFRQPIALFSQFTKGGSLVIGHESTFLPLSFPIIGPKQLKLYFYSKFKIKAKLFPSEGPAIKGGQRVPQPVTRKGRRDEIHINYISDIREYVFLTAL